MRVFAKSLGGVGLLLSVACSSGESAGGSAGAVGYSGSGGSAGHPTVTSGGAPVTTGGAGMGGTNSAGTAGRVAGGASGTPSGGTSPGGAGQGGMPSAGAPASGGMPSGGSGGAAQAGTGGSAPIDPACAPPTAYRNLFAELLSKTEEETDAKIEAAFKSLFQGGGDKAVYYEQGDEAYILDANNNDVRSEGVSYGMAIAVQLDKQAEFNKLWKFAKQHMAQGGASSGLFHWRTNTQGQVTGQGSAPDGEEYFATALIFASKRWGDGEGIYAYSSEAKSVLAGTKKSLFDEPSALVKFLPNANYTDPSYVLPAFYEVWVCFDQENEEFWKRAASAARAFLQKATHPQTGLAPYLANYNGTPSNALGGGSTFQSDAWRVVGNIMMDHHLFGADPWQTTWAAKFAAFFASANRGADEFNLDGSVIRQNGTVASTGLVSQNAMVGFGVPVEDGKPFVQVLWDLQIPSGRYRYYDGMLYMLALLHVSGRFHLWY